MASQSGPEEQLAELQAIFAGLGFHSDVGVSINLHGGPEDEELLRAFTACDYDSVRRALLATPYELEPRVVEMIVTDLRTGQAGVSVPPD